MKERYLEPLKKERKMKIAYLSDRAIVISTKRASSINSSLILFSSSAGTYGTPSSSYGGGAGATTLKPLLKPLIDTA